MVQGYVERGLLNVHDVGANQGVRNNLLYFLAGVVFVSILPYLHIGVFYKVLHGAKGKVNRTTCSCDCFDTVFRGPYEHPPSGYKHVYFNATINSLKIWIVTVIFIIIIYETLKYLLKLWQQQLLRRKMFYLVAMTTYAHYYSWWSYFGYYNEDFYYQWYHQTIFTITEIISTALVLNLCNEDNPMLPWKLLLIININTAHLITGGVDQFFSQLLSGTGRVNLSAPLGLTMLALMQTRNIKPPLTIAGYTPVTRLSNCSSYIIVLNDYCCATI
ncbi:unnamed protein product [Owenia fusiformis]|uniref:Uncharacterized protein n=1 Tax=Owenia fusiformis TaxID=6347 RepID=A0A8S4NKD7_OWEFU|nr:unnamed protein product [Owenia fusiformis]